MRRSAPGGETTVLLLVLVAGVAGAGSLAVVGTGQAASVAAEADAAHRPPVCRPSTAPPDPADPQLDCAAPPDTFDVSAFFSGDSTAAEQALAGPTFDSWAWATFAALNWPAQADPDRRTFPAGFRRGVPDLGLDFIGAAPDDVLVWETFKEKRELFQPTDTPASAKVTARSRWQAVTFDPGQEPAAGGGGAGGLPACAPRHERRAAELLARRGHHRILFQGRKHPTAGGTQTLDEVVEVASQAREAREVLCAGYDATTKPTRKQCLEVFPTDLDERTPVGPRVWKGNPKDPASSRPIFFEVKVNYDFWRYILDRGLQIDDAATAAALSASVDDHPKLPFRTSAPKGPGRSPQAVFGYSADRVVDGYRHLADPDVLPGVGSIQVKAGWLKLLPEEATSGAYHTTEAIYYRSLDPRKPEELCYEVDTFGLLGLHIIQRVHSRTFDRLAPGLFAPGGTFVFATWEHTSLAAEPSGLFYANYFAFPGPLAPLNEKFPFVPDLTPFPNFVRAPGGAIPVVREKPYPLATTAAVNEAVHDRLPADSPWRHYRLIGTQFLPVGSEADSLAFNQPYYLANLAVETNTGLQQFQGLPPGLSGNDMPTRGDLSLYYLRKVTLQPTVFSFVRNAPNVVFNRELKDPVNMGGCMGCHGVAQIKGYNFSFVFADGQAGSEIDTQYHFLVAGAIPQPNQ